MTTPVPLVSVWPPLLDARLASRGLRVTRAILVGVVSVVLPDVVAGAVGQLTGWEGTVLGFVAIAAFLLLGVIGWLWNAATGRTPVDLLLGIRLVRVDYGLRPGVRALLRGLLMGVFGLLTGGIVPFILALAGRDKVGRHWQDRLTGVALLDVRAGRDVIKHPASPAEIRKAQTPSTALPDAIVVVRPDRPDGRDSALLPPIIEALPSISAPPPVPEHSGVPESTRVVTAVPSAQSQQRTWILRFDTGQTALVHVLTLVGRAPAVKKGYSGADLVAVQDPSMTVSNTHAAFGATDLGVWVCDLGSTNGTAVLTAAGRERTIPAGSRVSVPAGGRVRLGDRLLKVQEAGR